MLSGTHMVCDGLWRWLQGTGLERFEFLRTGDEWTFRGTILTLAHDAAAEARYEITCDRSFCTKAANISVRDAAGERALQIATENGRWYENGRENLTVVGAIDIDLGWSPSTNTLPIKRLKLEIGQSSGEFVAAWVRFPELTLQPLIQEYVRLGQRKYRYSSRGGAFVAELLVDDHDLVLDYEGFWQRARKMH
ncbi:MAG TPA: putative glycolipid-binding domain-containing protein [Candidatus Angelobacter sp.]|nr:putative glycolipid-binding domain-containing protein [Candidatus Angelobacter sp.]